MSAPSTTLNVAAKPFVPSFGAAADASPAASPSLAPTTSSPSLSAASRPKKPLSLNPTAKSFIPSFELGSTATTTTAAPTPIPSFPTTIPPLTASSDSSASSSPAPPTPAAAQPEMSAPSTSTDSTVVPTSGSSTSAPAPTSASASPVDPLLSGLPAPPVRRAAGGAQAKVRKPKSAADEEEGHDRRAHHSSGAYNRSGSAYGSGSAGMGDSRRSLLSESSMRDFGALNGGGADGGEPRRYSVEFLLSLRSLPECRQPLPELDEAGCDAILNRYSASSSSSQSSNGDEGRAGMGSFRAHHQEHRVTVEKEKEGGANSSGWREAAASNAAAAATSTASTPSALTPSSSSLRPSLGLRPVSSLRPGLSTPAATTSSVGRLRPGKQTSFHTQQQNGPPQSGGGGGGGQGKGGQNTNGGGGGGGYRKKGPDAPLDIEVAPLEKTERRYTVVKDIPPDTRLLRSLNAILNKLTPEKFDTLVEQVLALRITNVGLLRDCVTAVFEKALAEPNFSPVYAQFCVRLSEALPAFPSEDPASPGEASFRKLILNQCQSEFENESHKLSAAQVESMSDAEKDEHATMVKRRTLGTIRFIGELYIRKMIASRILRHCASLLFGDSSHPVEEDIEALCRLLETTGKTLETSKGKDAAVNQEFLAQTMAQLRLLKDQKQLLSSRHRFMIADVLDVQKSGWVNRRAADTAKKISSIHEEAAKQDAQNEVQRMYMLMQHPAPQQNKPSPASRMARPTDRYALRPPPSATIPSASPPSASADEWETVKGGKGASAGKKPVQPASAHEEGEKKATTEEANAYALLTKRGGREEKEAEEEEAEDEDEVPSPQKTTATSSSAAAAGPALSDDDVRSRTQSILRELIASDDVSDALLSVQELGARNVDDRLVEEALMQAMEMKKDAQRIAISRLLLALHANGLLTRAHCEAACDRLFPAMDDIAIDLPHCEDHTALMVALLIIGGAMSLAYLQPSTLSTLSQDNPAVGPRFFLATLQWIKRQAGEERLMQLVQAAQKGGGASAPPLDLLASLDKPKVDQAKKFLTEKKLEQLAALL